MNLKADTGHCQMKENTLPLSQKTQYSDDN